MDLDSCCAERTKKIQFVTGVTAAVYRYNPAVIAQAFASLDILYPKRIGLGIGTGEDNNKGFDNDGFLNFIGKYFKIRNAKLYSPPSQDIPLYMAAVGEQSIKTAAKYSDGIITVVKPNKAAKIFDVFDKEAKENKRELGSLEKIAEYKVSFSEDYDEAFESTKFWRATAIENAFNLDINDPRELEQRAKEEVPDEK